MRRGLLIFGFASVLVICTVLSVGPLMSRVEQPDYTIVRSDGAFEIRAYGPIVVADTMVQGDRKGSIGTGFRTIAGYIFGGNAQSRKIAMTAPVLQQADTNGWRVRFVMPKGSTMETLPHPNDPRVTLAAVPSATYATVRFSGLARDTSVDQQIRSLLDYVARNKLKAVGAPILAFYDPPWTLPFLRRNEVMMMIDPAP